MRRFERLLYAITVCVVRGLVPSAQRGGLGRSVKGSTIRPEAKRGHDTRTGTGTGSGALGRMVWTLPGASAHVLAGSASGMSEGFDFGQVFTSLQAMSTGNTMGTDPMAIEDGERVPDGSHGAPQDDVMVWKAISLLLCLLWASNFPVIKIIYNAVPSLDPSLLR